MEHTGIISSSVEQTDKDVVGKFVDKFVANYNKQIDTPYIIGVYGGSCSGKSFVSVVIQKTITQIFKSKCSDVVIISQDSYYKGGNADTNYDKPESIDFDLLLEHMEMLFSGKSVKIPIYDFKTHQRKKQTITVNKAKIIIVEGILICTNEKLRNYFNMKIFIFAGEALQFARRLSRDINQRGRSIEEVKKRYFRDVTHSYNQHVLPSAQYADMTINNNGDDNYVGLEMVLHHIIVVLNKVCKDE